MFNPIFNPQVTLKHENALHVLIECILENTIPNEINIYAYRIGTGCFHVMKLDNQLDITITDGHVDIPDKENCLDSLRVGHIQIGVLDCMDVTYTIAHIIEQIKAKNNQLIYSYQTQSFMSTSNEPLNYEYAYIEIRNLLAYTVNVIASEVGDGVTPIDIGVEENEALKKRRQLAHDIVCTQTHSLHKSPHPRTLEQHDELIKKFIYYLTFITCDAAPRGVFTARHPELDTLRYPNFDNDVDEEFNDELKK